MKVLVGCECTGVVRRAFTARGHDAWSCDLLDTQDGSARHIKDDVRNVLEAGWDLAIFHPDCTYLTVSAAWAFKDGNHHQKVKKETLTGEKRRQARAQALDFVKTLWLAPIPRIAIENPIGAISTLLGPPSQIIQPYWFGENASKSTCLWLKNLPALWRRAEDFAMPRRVGTKHRWGNQTDSGQNRLTPSDDRWLQRASTYLGIAAAMAEQWTGEHEEKTLFGW